MAKLIAKQALNSNALPGLSMLFQPLTAYFYGRDGDGFKAALDARLEGTLLEVGGHGFNYALSLPTGAGTVTELTVHVDDSLLYTLSGVDVSLDDIFDADILTATLMLFKGNDQFNGSPDIDTFHGQGGNDKLAGRGGADTLFGEGGRDTLDGGEGSDSDALNGGSGDDKLAGHGGADTLLGEAGRDTLDGGTGTDTLNGGSGKDKLVGRGGADTLLGEAGQDTLDGGAGGDTLDGGSGKDTYLFKTAPTPEAYDQIVKFQTGETIELAKSAFAGLTEGTLPDEQFVIGTVAEDQDDRIVYDPASGALLHDADGDGPAQPVRFANMQSNFDDFSASNILVV